MLKTPEHTKGEQQKESSGYSAQGRHVHLALHAYTVVLRSLDQSQINDLNRKIKKDISSIWEESKADINR